MSLGLIDSIVIYSYGIALLLIALKCFKGNQNSSEYYVGNRKIKPYHIGLSVAATDVGGGFSIGLGALGFSMGLSGSWLLFSGLLGAFLSAVFLIPKIKRLETQHPLLSFPQVFLHRYGKSAAALAAVISLVGYTGFTSSQLLAGAKLSTVIAPEFSQSQILMVLALFVVIYTALGGFAAVVYTDSLQWLVLILGLSLVALPSAFLGVGGWAGLQQALPENFLSLTNISPQKFFNWMIAIVPIWFVAMTLYQRIYACPDVKSAKRAWYIAGFFEWPCMALIGAALGTLARAHFEQGHFGELVALANFDSELAIPMLLKNVLPIGVLGLVFSAYISAVLSTADSCLMAASGNLLNDIMENMFGKKFNSHKSFLRFSQLCTVVLGGLALFIALNFKSILDLMLLSYSIMISGLCVPAIAAVSKKKYPQQAALSAMLVGGGVSVLLGLKEKELQWFMHGFDANLFGILASLLAFTLACFFGRKAGSLTKA